MDVDKEFNGDSDETDDDKDNRDIRERYIEQRRYEKYMEQAKFQWDQFTGGNQVSKE